MFGTIGGPELILIFIVGLVVFGPRKLPEIGKSLGKMIAEFKKASSDFQRTVEDEIESERLKKDIGAAEYPHAALPEASEIKPAAPVVIREAEGTVPVSRPADGGESAASTPVAPATDTPKA